LSLAKWSSASELDKADMLDEFKEGAIFELPLRPGFTDIAGTFG
jgi:hypothetical protein